MALKDMMNMMLGIKAMKQDQERIELQKQQMQGAAAQQGLQNKAFALQTLQAILPNMRNPKQATKLVGFLSDNFDVSRETLQEQADQFFHTTQGQQAMLSADAVSRAQAGGALPGETAQYGQLSDAVGASTLAGGTPYSIGSNALMQSLLPTADQVPLPQKQAFQTRLTTGMSQGEFAIDQAKAGMSPDEIQQGARVQMGLAPSADNLLSARIQQQAQALQRELGFANIEQAYAQLAQNYGLQMIEAQQRGDANAAEAAAKMYQGTVDLTNAIKGNVELAGKPQTEAMRKILAENMKNLVPMLPTMQNQAADPSRHITNPIFPGQTKPIDFMDQRSWGRWWQP